MIPFCCIILCLSFILCLCVCLVLAHYFMILNDVASFIWWCEPINYCSCLVIVCGGIDRARRDYCKVLVMNIVLESKWRQRLAVSQCFLFASDLLVCIWYLNTWTSLHIAWSQYCIPTPSWLLRWWLDGPWSVGMSCFAWRFIQFVCMVPVVRPVLNKWGWKIISSSIHVFPPVYLLKTSTRIIVEE